MKHLAFVVPGPPQPWERVIPRAGGRSFVPKATREYEARVYAFAYRALMAAKQKPWDGPTFMVARFFIPRVKETRKMATTLSGQRIQAGVRIRRADASYLWPTRNEDGDTDNMVKAVKDGLGHPRESPGLRVVMNDKLVVAVAAWKLWAPLDRPEGSTDVMLFDNMAEWTTCVAALATEPRRV